MTTSNTIFAFGLIIMMPLSGPTLALDPTSPIDVFRFGDKISTARLANATLKNIRVADLAVALKADNIALLLDKGAEAGKVNFSDAFRLKQEFTAIENGDELLLKCLQTDACNVETHLTIAKRSSLYRAVALAHPEYSDTLAKQAVGKLSENMMTRFFERTGWSKIEGEVGRQGIDGLFVKRSRNGMVTDVLVVESKYDSSQLNQTKAGMQMSKSWALEKIRTLQSKYPNDRQYSQIEDYLQKDMYRSRLWQMVVKENNISIDLKKIDSMDDTVIVTDLRGGEKTKINYSGNNTISINAPESSFHKEIAGWYKSEIDNL